MRSEAQIEASRNNGSKSRGPTTEEGKARSSMNALTHGVYRNHSRAVATGPFAEDPDRVAADLAAIVLRLAPRDTAKLEVASTIAELTLDLRRVGRYKTVALQATTAPGAPTKPAEEVTDRQAELAALHNLERVLDKSCRLTSMLLRQLKAAMDHYEALSKMPIIGAADGERDPGVPLSAEARSNSVLWAARADYYEAMEARRSALEEFGLPPDEIEPDNDTLDGKDATPTMATDAPATIGPEASVLAPDATAPSGDQHQATPDADMTRNEPKQSGSPPTDPDCESPARNEPDPVTGTTTQLAFST